MSRKKKRGEGRECAILFLEQYSFWGEGEKGKERVGLRLVTLCLPVFADWEKKVEEKKKRKLAAIWLFHPRLAGPKQREKKNGEKKRK